MDGRIEMTEAGILDALRAALEKGPEGPDDAYTTAELAEMLGMDDDALRRQLRPMIRRGDAVCVLVRRVAMDGRRCKVPGYRLKPKTDPGVA